MDSVYPAIIELFSGEAFIESVQLLEIPENESDATAAVAVRVTTRNGHTDLCFNDPRRAVDGHLRIRRSRAVRLCVVRSAWIEAGADRRRHAIRNTAVFDPGSHFRRSGHDRACRLPPTQSLSGPCAADTPRDRWPQIELGNSEHRTSYTIFAAEQGPHGTVLEVDKAIDLGYAHVVRSDPELGVVTANLDQGSTLRGYDAGLTCTNEDMTRSWKCCALGDGRYKLMEEFSADHFPNGSIFRLWEFGERDIARLATHVYLVRVGAIPSITSGCGRTLMSHWSTIRMARSTPTSFPPMRFLSNIQVSFGCRENSLEALAITVCHSRIRSTLHPVPQQASCRSGHDDSPD